MSRTVPLLITIVALVMPPALLAEPPHHMTFKNNLVPGHQTRHRITRTVERTTKRGKKLDSLTYEQQATLTQCNIDESQPGNVMLYQMLVDRPAKVIAAFRNREKLAPTPPAERYNLPKGSTRLHSANRTPRDGPAQVPLVDPVQQAILFALLDVTHWPAKQVDAGHRWERPIAAEGFEGTQTFEFVDLVRENGEVSARVTLLVEGRFTGRLEREYRFGKGQAIVFWSRPERALVKLEGQADYERLRPDATEKYKLKLNVGLERIDALDADAQELVKVQLTSFANGLKLLKQNDRKAAAQVCADFRARWPRSTWTPAIAQLEQDIATAVVAADRLSTKQIKSLLVRTILTYEAARTNQEYDLLEKTQAALKKLADDYRGKLSKLARDKDEGVRSHAAFAMAFGSSPEDASATERAAKDKSPKVRAMALAGMAAQQKQNVSVDLLLARLDDQDAAVRRRACQAVGACVPREHFSIVKVVEKLDGLMVNDETPGVRREAVRALAAVGGAADIPKLEKALKHELDQNTRREIEKGIEMLEAGKE